MTKIWNKFKFTLERFVLRGPFFRLLIVISLIVAISFIGGGVVHIFGNHFESVWEAAWWAFLRLSDPGYLGDDRGTLLVTVSTIITVAGCVVFLGAMVAIMTQWFNQTINRLEAGHTDISEKKHIVILGWNHRTPIIIKEILHSESRVKKFLKRSGSSYLKIGLLSEFSPPILFQDLKEQLQSLWSPSQILIRSGDYLKAEHLNRVAIHDASVVIIPSNELDPALESTPDGNTIKSLMTIASTKKDQDLPYAVAEIIDNKKTPLAVQVYPGAIEVIPSHQFISRLFVQSLRNEGLSSIYSELLGHEWGNELYLRECPELVGTLFQNLFEFFPNSISVGLVRKKDGNSITLLNPGPEEFVQENDRIILISENYKSSYSHPYPHKITPQQSREITHKKTKNSRKILILGWNQRVPSILEEFVKYTNELSEITLISRQPTPERCEAIKRIGINTDDMHLNHVIGDYTSPSDLSEQNLNSFDSVLILSSDLLETDTTADARTVLGYLVLENMIKKDERIPHIIVELLNPNNFLLLKDKSCEVIISPVVISHILAQVALRKELNSVFEELFQSDGAEIKILSLDSILPDNSQTYSFNEIQRICSSQQMIALGYQIKSKRTKKPPIINPEKDKTILSTRNTFIIVLTK